ncbi:hypothetical protein BU15DRAFT_15356, partial [Melanogaster broomeanus]
HLNDPLDPVNQEDGYMSPSPSYFRSATPDLMSPVRREREQMYESTDDFGADIISSPIAARLGSPLRRQRGTSVDEALGEVFTRGTPPVVTAEISGPDLRDILSICSADDVEEIDSHETSDGSTPSNSGPVTPDDTDHIETTPAMDLTISDDSDPCVRATRMQV